VVVTAGIAVLLGTASAQNTIAEYLERVLGVEEARVIVAMMRHAVERLQSSGMAAWVAMGSTLLGASVTFLELKAALASIWGTRPASGSGAREMITGRLNGLALALGIGFLLGVTMLAEAALRTAVAWVGEDLPGFDLMAGFINLFVVNAFSTILFATLLSGLAPDNIGWRDAIPAALVITVLFALGRYLIAAYLTHAGVTSAYGAAGSSPQSWCGVMPRPRSSFTEPASCMCKGNVPRPNSPRSTQHEIHRCGRRHCRRGLSRHERLQGSSCPYR
jgi:membrane protein